MSTADLDISQGGPSINIWTPDVGESFYKNTCALLKKLNKSSPRVPQDYRGLGNQSADAGQYTLLYEQELHIADHFAFLAHVEEGVKFVSAVTLEESRNPPALTVRLASNHTPKPEVIDGLYSILDIIKEHAYDGKKRDEYKSKLFDEVLRFSRKRIHGRLRSSRWEKPSYLTGCDHDPLHSRVGRISVALNNLTDNLEHVKRLQETLPSLVDSLKKVDTEKSPDDIAVLRNAVLKSYEVSNQGTSRSLESNLRRLGVGEEINQCREVLEIDKLSKYYKLCGDFIRFGRQIQTRTLCQNLNLQNCTAYPGCHPPGSTEECFVHSEIQLVLFYARNSRQLQPRAIGSSKSACFLCDRFIKRYGSFGVSHSHMTLYTQWTIPQESWMNPEQIQHFRSIIRDMDDEIQMLLRQKPLYLQPAIQSRAHLLLVETSSTEPSVLGSQLPQSSLDISNRQKMSLSPLLANSNSRITQHTLYYFEDLPITITVVPSTLSCTLLCGAIDYIFDLEEVQRGQVMISQAITGVGETGPEYLPVDIQQLTSVPIEISGKDGCLSILVYDKDKHGIYMSFTWLSNGD